MCVTLGNAVRGTIALTFVFGLAACDDFAADRERKPALMALLVDRATGVCDTQPAERDQASYAQRLTDVLYDVPVRTLDFFKDNEIAICLDKRLADQTKVFMGTFAEGVYYPSENILTLWDNGKAEGHRGFLDASAATRGYIYLNAFRSMFGEGSGGAAAPMIGYSYRASCGENCLQTLYGWKSARAGNSYPETPPVPAFAAQ